MSELNLPQLPHDWFWRISTTKHGIVVEIRRPDGEASVRVDGGWDNVPLDTDNKGIEKFAKRLLRRRNRTQHLYDRARELAGTYGDPDTTEPVAAASLRLPAPAKNSCWVMSARGTYLKIEAWENEAEDPFASTRIRVSASNRSIRRECVELMGQYARRLESIDAARILAEPGSELHTLLEQIDAPGRWDVRARQHVVTVALHVPDAKEFENPVVTLEAGGLAGAGAIAREAASTYEAWVRRNQKPDTSRDGDYS